MAWAHGAWVDLINTHGAPGNIAAAASANGQIDCNGATKFETVNVRVQIIFGGTPDGDVVVEVFDHDLDDQAQDADYPSYEVSIPFAVGVQRILSLYLDVRPSDAISIVVTNNDTADNVSCWVQYMAGYYA